MARKTKEEAERTYYLLLDAAMDEFIERGVAQTTLLQIATRAGLTRGAVYWHFKNKDELIMALWDYVAGEYLRQFRHELQHIEPEQGVEKFKQLVLMMVTGLAEDRRLQQIIHIITNVMDYATVDSDIAVYMSARSEEIYTSVVAALKTLKEHGLLKIPQSPELIASGVYAYFMGLAELSMAHACGMEHHVELEGNAEDLVELMTCGWF